MKKLKKRSNLNSVEAYACMCWYAACTCSCTAVCNCSTDYPKSTISSYEADKIVAKIGESSYQAQYNSENMMYSV
ncbi:hypothetical protein GCM10023142_01730 [Anaerocolumna aminovalerica]|jgi:hypothetical protein|uniref:Uncharacterized protein n=1 Tax=Anaerocolumna aminovalerica TaxID=1527 RepID=A0A1I5BJD7_9FIRM|nr:hypothetical protein [Anaerocolumna aminovalerica]MBU5331489.1 hypothetical protein [Anaerocolumna aminovalerica]MDU6265750.1 hypothetical protein [Anaerocolumna aminovalerica]SFN74591.1 hypothetical protein SAMN04489757_10131 [Anaerocolumna aminovalerica]